MTTLSKKDRDALSSAFSTEVARLKRSINSASNQAIKEILDGDVRHLLELEGRLLQLPEAKK